MSDALPPFPDPELVADLCREQAADQQLPPEAIEKDFRLTRLLWRLGIAFGDSLLLKGGTLLSKVDMGFRRMSEDADFILPDVPSTWRRTNALRMNSIRDALREFAGTEGLRLDVPHGIRGNKDAHCNWRLDYASKFGPQSILLEVSIRPALRRPRQVALKQMLDDPLLGDYTGACCWALEQDEARAEKVRAALTRNAIRDFYDLDQLLRAGADLSSPSFLRLVDEKLAEIDAPPVAQQPPRMGVVGARRDHLLQAIGIDLAGVLRLDAPPFDLDGFLDRIDALWRK